MKREPCPVCNKGTAQEVRGPRRVTVQGRGYVVPGDRFMRCLVCGEEYYTGAQARASSLRLNEIRRKAEGLLAPDKIRAIRRRLGVSQAALEKILGLGPKTVVRWERGSVLPSKSADDVLRLLEKDASNLRYLARVRGAENLLAQAA